MGFWDEHKRRRKLKVGRVSGPVLMLRMRGSLGREQSLLLRGIRREGPRLRLKPRLFIFGPWPGR